MDIEIDMEKFTEEMKKYEDLFPDVKIVVEFLNSEEGDVYYVEIANNIKVVKEYKDVILFLDSFIGQDLPIDPQVKIDREAAMKEFEEIQNLGQMPD